MAAFSKPTPKPKDLEAKGRLQGYLRCQAANELRNQPAKYADACPQGVDILLNLLSTAGVRANAVRLHALACSLRCQLRVWTWSPQLSKWMLYIVGPPRTKKQKGKKPGDLTAMLNAEARRARGLQSYKKFVAGLKAKKWQSSACRPAENTPLVVCAEFESGPQKSTRHTCESCGHTAALTEFRRYPCKLRHPKVSVYSWHV